MVAISGIEYGTCWINLKFAICLLAVVIGCQAISDEDALRQFQEYQGEFGKSYRSLVEHRHRFALFKQKLQEIEEHNKLYVEGKVTWYQGLTPFSDWTTEEFENYVNKNKYEEFNGDEQLHKSTNLSVPASLDWRLYGAVSEVKNQGNCGSCWTFSSIGALEGAAKLKNPNAPLVPLSEQNLLDCASTDFPGFGCNGGTTIGAFTYVQKHGVTTEAAYPYTGVQGACKSTVPVQYATGIVRVPNENDLLNAVATVGPISVAVFASPTLNSYKGGIVDDPLCNGNQVNHGVLLVGYGSENGVNYWILKNSWGPNWGEDGYWRIVRGKNSCSVAVYATYALV